MIDQSALEQGSVTYQEIVAEGKRLVDALKELAVEPKQQNSAIVPEGKQIIEALKELAVAVSIYHREQFPEFPRDIGAPSSGAAGGDLGNPTSDQLVLRQS